MEFNYTMTSLFNFNQFTSNEHYFHNVNTPSVSSQHTTTHVVSAALGSRNVISTVSGVQAEIIPKWPRMPSQLS